MAAAGTSASTRPYGYRDEAAPAGTLYYRLRQVNADGTVRYSSVRTVAVARQANLRLYPNPAHGSALVTGLASGTHVVLLDAVGRAAVEATADTAGTARLS